VGQTDDPRARRPVRRLNARCPDGKGTRENNTCFPGSLFYFHVGGYEFLLSGPQQKIKKEV